MTNRIEDVIKKNMKKQMKTLRKFKRVFKKDYITALEFTIHDYQQLLGETKNIFKKWKFKRRIKFIKKIIKETRRKNAKVN